MSDFTPATSFSFFASYYEALQLLDDERRLAIFDAMTAFAFEGELPAFDDVTLKLAWSLIFPNLQRSVENSVNGKKGGRPKKAEG